LLFPGKVGGEEGSDGFAGFLLGGHLSVSLVDEAYIAKGPIAVNSPLLYISVMTQDELIAERERLGLSRPKFGEWLAAKMGKARPYTQSEIYHWETGRRSVPAAVEVVFLRERLK
jgi:hypothetical protein